MPQPRRNQTGQAQPRPRGRQQQQQQQQEQQQQRQQSKEQARQQPCQDDPSEPAPGIARAEPPRSPIGDLDEAFWAFSSEEVGPSTSAASRSIEEEEVRSEPGWHANRDYVSKGYAQGASGRGGSGVGTSSSSQRRRPWPNSAPEQDHEHDSKKQRGGSPQGPAGPTNNGNGFGAQQRGGEGAATSSSTRAPSPPVDSCSSSEADRQEAFLGMTRQALLEQQQPQQQPRRGLLGWYQGLKAQWPYFVKKWDEMRKTGVLVQAISILGRHVLAGIGLYRVCTGRVGWKTGALSIGMWVVSGTGVTAGVHRLWSHQAYHPSRAMEILVMIMFSMADQGTILGWSLTHAMHHAASDTENDPHNRSQGWWHSHFGWLFATKTFRISQYDYYRVLNGHSDVVKWHDKVFILWDPLWSLGLPALLASFWGEAVNGFFVPGALRWFCVQHITFFVNSVAHGEREPGSTEFSFDYMADGIGPKVSLLTTICALGEGWHDYHHLFPWDYAAAELGAWDQWNPTKVFLDLCYNCGLVYKRRRCTTSLQLARRKQMLEQGGAPAELVNCSYRTVGLPFLRRRQMIPQSENIADATASHEPIGKAEPREPRIIASI
mmetsp:Transcript_32347/g.69275  ORF Transcript_32347/g.69275 Transcript_32347/m.69275 type:complete len:604 (+) Transcript_32347:204-2015(+)